MTTIKQALIQYYSSGTGGSGIVVIKYKFQ